MSPTFVPDGATGLRSDVSVADSVLRFGYVFSNTRDTRTIRTPSATPPSPLAVPVIDDRQVTVTPVPAEARGSSTGLHPIPVLA